MADYHYIMSLMKQTLFERLRPAFVSMGMAFYQTTEARVAIDPEKIILEAIPIFFEDRKVFRMLLRWCEVVSPFIHIERLAILSADLDQNAKIVLGAVAKKLALLGDRRWTLIERKMREEIPSGAMLSLPEGYASEWLIQKNGTDSEFESFGVRLGKIEPEDPKKLLTLAGIMERQPWLRLRALIGPNFRADLIYFLGTGQVKNPNQASKVIGCSRAAASRLWREIQLYPELARVVA